MSPCRHLVFVLGDQLDEHSTALADVDPATDIVLMAEVPEESNHVWSSKARTTFFFATMRHFAAILERRKFKLDYRRIGTHPFESLVTVLSDAVRKYRPQAIVVVEPGDWRVEQGLLAFGRAANVEMQIREDTHFLCSRRAFADWAKGYKQPRLEHFYRMMRRRHDIMMEGSDPLQGRWNFDAENRGAFSKAGPTNAPAALRIRPDAITREAMADVEKHFAGHPGTLDHFAWPVTRKDALRALQAFVSERLALFGRWGPLHFETLRRERAIHQAHVELLRRMPLPARSEDPRRRLPRHHALLAFSRSARRNAGGKSAHVVDGKKHRQNAGRGPRGAPGAGHGDA